MKVSKQQSGWTVTGILGVIISSFIGAFCANFFMGSTFADPSKFNPFLIGSIFLTPLAVCMPLTWRVFDLKSSVRLSVSERRRITPLINEKVRQYIFAITFYISGFILTIITLGIINKPSALFSFAIVLLGGLMGISIFSIYLIISEYLHIADFKSNLENRAETKRRRKAALKRLSTDDNLK